MARTRNEQLAGLLAEAGWSRAQAASAFNRAAAEGRRADDPCGPLIGRSHVSMWVGGTRPSGSAPAVLARALSRRLRRVVTVAELGFGGPGPAQPGPSAEGPSPDALSVLADLGRADLHPDRRNLLAGIVYSTAFLAVPTGERPPPSAPGAFPPPAERLSNGLRVAQGDVATVRELTLAFSAVDQRRGGGHGRTALVQYLHTDVRDLLHGRYAHERVRREMESAAAELAYLSGWMAFDSGENPLAQRYFVLGLQLAEQAEDHPLCGHILRAMAHQALDMGHFDNAIALAEASVQDRRYTAATPRERALLGVVHARALAAAGRTRGAVKALLRAENDLTGADGGVAEPHRTFFFGEASLAHETARTLEVLGDRKGAIREFGRSVRTRGAAFRRTHAVTLGHLGAAQMADGRVEEACVTWGGLLDSMEEGIQSGRAEQAVVQVRRLLSPLRHRRIAPVTAVAERANRHLARLH
ncbi:Tat pathway signal protein [Streptomyces sp. AM 2-1-1]|uniref:Tat pathway signal protein n=1 Tax=Streptomyces sp. AM 2-1-1 TaxID=3028709 RepID=UPI0023B9A3C5|nr:Tat pathway signal protein [Streptomyces sp. AM 2-1-1]WEH39847.1 Tat pathway signal protein [Streptomyces sp. AM 2-1-1]